MTVANRELRAGSGVGERRHACECWIGAGSSPLGIGNRDPLPEPANGDLLAVLNLRTTDKQK